MIPFPWLHKTIVQDGQPEGCSVGEWGGPGLREDEEGQDQGDGGDDEEPDQREMRMVKIKEMEEMVGKLTSIGENNLIVIIFYIQTVTFSTRGWT